MKAQKVAVTGLSVLAGFAMMAFNVQAEITGPGIQNSGHNFGEAAWNTDTAEEICLPCHAPHGNGYSVPEIPMWNHKHTEQVFTPYSSPTLDATDVGAGDPQGVSGVTKLCLSCHDGTVAVDEWTRHTGSAFFGQGVGRFVFGRNGNLANVHPMSFTYDQNLANLDGELHDPTAKTFTVGGKTKTIAKGLLFGPNFDQMECGSCHDVHNANGFDHMLQVPIDGSRLCLTCHDK